MTNPELARIFDSVKQKRRRPTPKYTPTPRDDGRLGAAVKKYDALVSGITRELGGNLTIMQAGFVEALAGCRISLDDLNTRRMLGLPVNSVEYSTLASAMVKLSERIERRTPQHEEA